MLRFVRSPDGAVGFDVHARRPGRGAWTCPRATCVTKAIARGGLERAFEAPIVAKEGEALTAVRTMLSEEIRAGLGLLQRQGTLAAGRQNTWRAVEEGGVAAFLLAGDLSPRTGEEVRRRIAQEGHSMPVLVAATCGDIGAAIGRQPTGVVAVRDTPRTHIFLDDLVRAHLLAEGDEEA
jgi:hypothetical protein